MHKRKEITFEKKIKKIVKEAQKELKELKKIEFACEEGRKNSPGKMEKGKPLLFAGNGGDLHNLKKRKR